MNSSGIHGSGPADRRGFRTPLLQEPIQDIDRLPAIPSLPEHGQKTYDHELFFVRGASTRSRCRQGSWRPFHGGPQVVDVRLEALEPIHFGTAVEASTGTLGQRGEKFEVLPLKFSRLTGFHQFPQAVLANRLQHAVARAAARARWTAPEPTPAIC